MPAPESSETLTAVLEDDVVCAAFHVFGSFSASAAAWNLLSAVAIAFRSDWCAVIFACCCCSGTSDCWSTAISCCTMPDVSTPEARPESPRLGAETVAIARKLLQGGARHDLERAGRRDGAQYVPLQIAHLD